MVADTSLPDALTATPATEQRGGARRGKHLGTLGESSRQKSTSREKPPPGGLSHRRKGGERDPPQGSLQMFTSDFQSMHKQKCQAAHYKVHRPGCSCSSTKRLRKRFTVAAPSSSAPPHSSDGLIVLPDTKSARAFYLCSGTGAAEFDRDRKAAERKLYRELFPKSTGADSSSGYKVSCAQCLLEDEPNGFACVSSSSRPTVEAARDLSRYASRKKEEGGAALHADHAQHVAALPRKLLWQFEAARTRDQNRAARLALVRALVGQGIPEGECGGTEMKLGHHLSSLLHISKQDPDAASVHWLVMLQASRVDARGHGPPSSGGGTVMRWAIDLPGGKRHLGETSLEGTVREVEEEVSLRIDPTWVYGEPRRSTQKSNLYHMLRVPGDVLMEMLENMPAWKEKGFCKEPVAALAHTGADGNVMGGN